MTNPIRIEILKGMLWSRIFWLWRFVHHIDSAIGNHRNNEERQTPIENFEKIMQWQAENKKKVNCHSSC